MSLIYNDTQIRKSRAFNVKKFDATIQFAVHLENSFRLKKILRMSSDPIKKIQACNELVIAERKMNFWSRQENFNDSVAAIVIRRMRRMFAS